MDEAPCMWRIQVSIEQVVMFGLINKKLVEYIRDYSQQVFWQCFKMFGDQDRVLKLN